MAAPQDRFPRQVRLVNAADFQQVFQGSACRSVDDAFTVLARPNGLGHPRLGLAISRKVLSGAVGRNRVKRIVRESFRHHQEMLGGLDLVVLGRNALAARSNPELFAALERHWQKVVTRCKTS